MILVQNSNVPGVTYVKNLVNKIASTKNQSHLLNAATYACLLTCSGEIRGGGPFRGDEWVSQSSRRKLEEVLTNPPRVQGWFGLELLVQAILSTIRSVDRVTVSPTLGGVSALDPHCWSCVTHETCNTHACTLPSLMRQHAPRTHGLFFSQNRSQSIS